MFKWIRRRVLLVLRLPPEPQPPSGAPGSVRVFRAASGYYYLMLLGWAMAQAATLVGIAVSLSFLWSLQEQVDQVREEMRADRVGVSAAAEPGRRVERRSRNQGGQQLAHTLAPHAWWLFPLVKVGEAIAIAAYLVQLVATFVAVRLEFELRWYIVTDRSLRIRTGVWKLQEITMSFANLQQVSVTQGPLQRLLAIADLQVQSAGGGGGGGGGHGSGKQRHQDMLHTGAFHGVGNAPEIRDLVLERLRRFREAGLGDPDDVAADLPSTEAAASLPGPAEVLAAAHELRREAWALRTTADGRVARGPEPAAPTGSKVDANSGSGAR